MSKHIFYPPTWFNFVVVYSLEGISIIAVIVLIQRLGLLRFTMDFLALINQMVWITVFMWSSILLVSLFHELGHLIVGRLVGFRVMVFGILGFKLDFRPQSKRLSFDPLNLVKGVGGEVSLLPRGIHQLKNRYSAYLAGGIVANVVTAGLALVIIPFSPSVTVTYGLAFFALYSVIVALRNLIPLNHQGYQTDGLKLYHIGSDSPGGKYMLAWLTIDRFISSGVAPSRWYPEVVQDLLALNDGSLQDIEGMFRAAVYARSIAANEQARKLVGRAMQAMRPYDNATIQKLYEDEYIRWVVEWWNMGAPD